MFKNLSKMMKYLKLVNYGPKDGMSTGSKNTSIEYIPTNINDVLVKLRNEFASCEDIVIRRIQIGQENKIKAILIYMDGLVNKEVLNSHVLRPLLIDARIATLDKPFNKNNVIEVIERNFLDSCEILEIKDFKQTLNNILSGDTLIYIDGQNIALATCTRGFATRPVGETNTETTIRGSREGFTESFRVNTSLLRRRIRNPRLKIENMTIGQQTGTKVGIAYLDGIVNKKLVEEVRRRLSSIQIDSVLESGDLEQLIDDAPFSIFSTIGNTEKPDKTAAKILEGRVAIITDGTPFVLTVPNLFIEGFQVSEDYYTSPYFASFVRLLRFLAFLVSLYGPALYVALLSFHHSVVPFELLMTIAKAREGLPFSSFNEALIMGVAFELLREAGVRMPRPIGQAVSIVGALVLGEASIRAGITGAPMVIVTALTAICSFIVPSYSGMMPLIRFSMVAAANTLGLTGIAMLSTIGLIHMCSLRSFGVPYMSPFAPISLTDLKDTFIRAPLWLMFTRPRSLTGWNTDSNRIRMSPKLPMEDQ